MPKGPYIGSASKCPCKFNCETYTVTSKYIIIVFSSYMTLLTLTYGDRMEKTLEACCRAEQEELSFREAKWVVEMELFLDKYPCWNMGAPHQSVILHEMFLHATSWGRKEVEHMCHQGHPGSMREPSSEADQSTLHLLGYHTSQREMRDVYHNMYLLNREPGFPSCGEAKRRRQSRRFSPPFRIGCKGGHLPPKPGTLLEAKGSQPHKFMRQLYELPTRKL